MGSRSVRLTSAGDVSNRGFTTGLVSGPRWPGSCLRLASGQLRGALERTLALMRLPASYAFTQMQALAPSTRSQARSTGDDGRRRAVARAFRHGSRLQGVDQHIRRPHGDGTRTLETVMADPHRFLTNGRRRRSASRRADSPGNRLSGTATLSTSAACCTGRR